MADPTPAYIEVVASTPDAYLERVTAVLARPPFPKPFAMRYLSPAVDGKLLRVETQIRPDDNTLRVLAIAPNGESHRLTLTRQAWRAELAALIATHTPTPPIGAPAGTPTPDRARRTVTNKVGETLSLF